MKRPRLRDWLNPTSAAPEAKAHVRADDAYAFRHLLAALRSNAPGQWSQNPLEQARHFTSAVFLAINTLAKQAENAEVKVLVRDDNPDNGFEELPYSDPVCRLLEDPNPEDNAGDLWYQITQQLSLTGMSLVWAPRDNPLNVPSELYVIPTATALPQPPSPDYPEGSYLVQPYYPYGGYALLPGYQSAAGARIPADQVVRIKNHHPLLRYDGYAVLTALSLQIDTVEAIDRARWSAQQKGIDPTIAMTFDPNVFDPDEADLTRLRAQLEALYAGPHNAGKILFNPFGSTVSKLSNTPMEMSWQEGWAQLVDFVLASYDVPKSVAGLQESVSYATLYSSLRQFYLLSLNPLLNKIAGRFNKHLIRPYFGPDLVLQLRGQKIDDENIEELRFANDLKAGVRTVNERRKYLGLDPKPWGEERAWGTNEPQDLPAKTTEPVSDPDERAVDSTRPANPLAAGSLGPRKSLLDALEKHKTNGTVMPIRR
jgi:phage portal protein BeeE